MFSNLVHASLHPMFQWLLFLFVGSLPIMIGTFLTKLYRVRFRMSVLRNQGLVSLPRFLLGFQEEN